MPFEKIEFQLTEAQMETLKPFADSISTKRAATVIAEIFIHKEDQWRYGKTTVRLLDERALKPISAALGAAEKDYDKRQDRARRFGELKDILEARTATVTTITDEALIVERDGHKYELREVERAA